MPWRPQTPIDWIMATVLLLGPLCVALFLNRPRREVSLVQFAGDTLFGALCLSAIMTGIAFGFGALTKLTDPGCHDPPGTWHGCRANDSVQEHLGWAVFVVICFIAGSCIWRFWRLLRGDRRREAARE